MSATESKTRKVPAAKKPSVSGGGGPEETKKEAKRVTAGTDKPVRKQGKEGPRKKTTAGPAKTASRAKKGPAA